MAEFYNTSQPLYWDHWVSNVICRTRFMDVLKDILGYAPKVNFNAYVFVAGESPIESTVLGHDSTLLRL